jgi:hypothetical protein
MRIVMVMSTARPIKGGKTETRGDGTPSKASPLRRSNKKPGPPEHSSKDPNSHRPGNSIATSGPVNKALSDPAATTGVMEAEVGAVVEVAANFPYYI